MGSAKPALKYEFTNVRNGDPSVTDGRRTKVLDPRGIGTPFVGVLNILDISNPPYFGYKCRLRPLRNRSVWREAIAKNCVYLYIQIERTGNIENVAFSKVVFTHCSIVKVDKIYDVDRSASRAENVV